MQAIKGQQQIVGVLKENVKTLHCKHTHVPLNNFVLRRLNDQNNTTSKQAERMFIQPEFRICSQANFMALW